MSQVRRTGIEDMPTHLPAEPLEWVFAGRFGHRAPQAARRSR